MKKYIAALAALAVVGTAGVLYLDNKMDTEAPADQSSTTTSTYSQSGSSKTTGSTAAAIGDKSQTQSTETTSEKAKEYIFNAEIDDISGTSLKLKVEEDSGAAKSADKIVVDFDGVEAVDSQGKRVKADDVANFKNVTVYYDGTIMETYPAQVKATKIVFKNRTDCNIYFCLQDGEVIDTVTVPVGSTLDSADMPNAGAYCDDGYHFEGWLLNGEKVFGVDNIRTNITLVAEIRKD